MDGYTPGEGWEPLYSQDQISSAVNAALKATAPDERVKELEAELAATEIAIAEYRQQCLDNAAEIARLRSESEERLQNCAALVAEVERLRAAPATTPEQPRPFIPWSKEAEMLESWAAHLSHHKETP
jgi:septal ring factor EnvC (AmiA/AmiB activator)